MADQPLDHGQAIRLREAIEGLDGVSSLNGGTYGEVALLFPGERVRGLHVASPRDGSPKRLEVYVTVDGSSLPDLNELARSIRGAAARFTDMPVDVTVNDVA